jgi:predicted nucleic acid-binding protein
MTVTAPTPILAIDTSALLRRYVPDAHAGLVAASMAAAPIWCASALARAELLAALHRLSMAPFQHEELWRSARADWDAFHVVPVDGRCLSAAAELAARFGLAVGDAIHLAAADRLPRPVRYLSFERRQLSAAVELGFDVVTPTDR